MDQGRGGFGRTPSIGHDVTILEFLAVECGVVIQILSQRGSFQSDTGKQALRPRPRENLGVHLRVGLSGRCPSYGAGGDRRFGAQSELTLKQFVRALSDITSMIRSVSEPPI